MKNDVAIVHYNRPIDSVAEAIDLSNAFDQLKKGDRVFIKPNIVAWSRHALIPPWGVITTSRVVADVVHELRIRGAGEIIIGEGIITLDPRDKETPEHAYNMLGYYEIAKKYNVKVVNSLERAFRKIDLAEGVSLNFSADLLDSDFIVSLPVLKTHSQTKVSLSQKNFKGCIDLDSRKKCHSNESELNLDRYVSKLVSILPKGAALIDGIYSLERGPLYTGTAHRTNLLVASGDFISADIVGSALLGIDPLMVPHIALACKDKGIDPSIESVEIIGEPVEMWAKKHEWDFPYNKEGTLPLQMSFMGIKGLSFPKYDHSLCSYCSLFMGAVQMAVARAWKKDVPFDNVEILTGKSQVPSKGMNHTLLLGRCQTRLNRDHPDIIHPIPINGCPPKIEALVDGLKKAGIYTDRKIFENIEFAPRKLMAKYEKRPEFSLDFYRITN